ncbi:MAG TPA: hypothetical protein VE093_06880 [Polyangiaceae bacterium]|nr:hypothetical protein [Polyangiaceae bacterium]
MNNRKAIVKLAACSILGSLIAACVGAEPGGSSGPSPAEAPASPEVSPLEGGERSDALTSGAAPLAGGEGNMETDEPAIGVGSEEEEDTTSLNGMTCTCFDCEWTPRCLGKCQAYPNTLRHVGSYPDIDFGQCQGAANNWCLAHGYGFATFACWGHL